MTVGELKDYLSLFSDELLVIVSKEIDPAGYGILERLEPGIYAETDYGNDFYPEQEIMVRNAEMKALCLTPEKFRELEDYKPSEPPK